MKERIIENSNQIMVQFCDKIKGFDEQFISVAKKEDVAKISSGTPLFADSTSEMTDITRNYVNTTDGYLYIYNGSIFEKSNIVYQSTGLSNKSVKLHHFSYDVPQGIPSKNLFDNETLTQGYLNNGYIATHGSKWVSDYIECLPNEYYIATDKYYNTGGDINFFDENKLFISQITNTNNTFFLTPTNARYIRVTVRTEWINSYQLEKGKIRTLYTSHYPKTLIEDKSIDENKLNFDFPKVEVAKNLYNKDTSIAGKYVNYTNGNLDPNVNYCASDFIEVVENEKYYMRYKQQFAFYNSEKGYLSGVENSNLIEVPTGAKYIRVTTLLTNNDSQQIEKGESFTNYEEYCYIISDSYKIKSSNILDLQISNNKEEINIYVSKSIPSNFTSIQTAINSCTDKNKIYNIFIKNGVYNEVNLSVKQDNINLIGESIDNTIIYADGSTIDGEVRDKHSLDICCNSKIQNITFIGENTKYVLHQDFDNSNINGSYRYNAYFRNCKFIKKTPDYQITGFGCRAGQNNYFENCSFIYEGGDVERYGILWHNWNNQNDGCELYVKNCDFINCSPFYLSELGSNHTDNIYIENIKCNLPTGGITYTCNGQYYIPSGSSEPLGLDGDYTTVPYCIKVHLNSNINKIKTDDTRPLQDITSLENYSSCGKNIKNTTIKKGCAISLDYSNLASGRNAIKLIENNKLDGVALENINKLEFGNYALHKKVCYGLCSSGNYRLNDLLKVNSDATFSTTVNENEAVAVVLENKDLLSEGLIEMLLI